MFERGGGVEVGGESGRRNREKSREDAQYKKEQLVMERIGEERQ